jgi:hypothetical protein
VRAGVEHPFREFRKLFGLRKGRCKPPKQERSAAPQRVRPDEPPAPQKAASGAPSPRCHLDTETHSERAADGSAVPIEFSPGQCVFALEELQILLSTDLDFQIIENYFVQVSLHLLNSEAKTVLGQNVV